MYCISSHLQGHCRDCKYKPVKRPNSGCNELMPAEKLDSYVAVDCPFRKVVCNHCREEIAANQFKVSEEIIITSRACTWSCDSLCVLLFLSIGPSKLVPQGSNGVWEVSSKDCKRCSKCTWLWVGCINSDTHTNMLLTLYSWRNTNRETVPTLNVLHQAVEQLWVMCNT